MRKQIILIRRLLHLYNQHHYSYTNQKALTYQHQNKEK